MWVWYSDNAGSDPNNDTFHIDFSGNSGSTWTNAKTLRPGRRVRQRRLVLPRDPRCRHRHTQQHLRARFVADDAGSGSIIKGAVDELAIFDYDCTDCVADFNGDGIVNTQDVLAFLNAWNAGDSSADINGDGSVNTQDVLAYLNLWNAGC